MGSTPVAVLGSSAKSIPLVGLGTAEYPFGESDIKRSVLDAIEVGYRHLDTASVYKSEKPVGDAVAESVRRGLIKSRDELFITSKLWCSDAHPDLVVPALRKTLQNLGMEYVDLYLVHFPATLKVGALRFPFEEEDLLPTFDMRSIWEAMEECHHLGLAKSIGISNFSCNKIETLLSTARMLPAVNQVEVNPVWQQKKLRDFCKAKGIHVTAYCPLGAKGTLWGGSQVMDNNVLKEIAARKGKTVAQVCLRWLHQQGVSVVPKSFNKGRMKENLEIFDWELTPGELEKINHIPQQRVFSGLPFVSDKGPYKSLDDFWDE